MRKVVARVHRGLAWVILTAVITQFFLAGLGIFGAAGFGAHMMTGNLIGVASLILVILALVGRLGGATIGRSALLLVLTIVQSLLPRGRSLIAALHPVNALAILFVALLLARRGMAVGVSLRPAGL